MALKRNLETEEGRAFWDYAEKIAKNVERWPAWKRNEVTVSEEIHDSNKERANTAMGRIERP